MALGHASAHLRLEVPPDQAISPVRQAGQPQIVWPWIVEPGATEHLIGSRIVRPWIVEPGATEHLIGSRIVGPRIVRPGIVGPEDRLASGHSAAGTASRQIDWAGGTSDAEITWFGTMSASWPNHHSDSWVKILPLSGDRRRQHDVVDAHPVGGDQDEIVTVRVQIADLAGITDRGPCRNRCAAWVLRMVAVTVAGRVGAGHASRPREV